MMVDLKLLPIPTTPVILPSPPFNTDSPFLDISYLPVGMSNRLPILKENLIFGT
jgi:hypothetical protein